MIIDLITLEKSPFEFDLEFSPEEIDLESDEAKLKGGANLSGILTKHIVQTDIEGKINAELELECTRCLQKVDQNFEIPFQTAFVASEHFTQNKEAELNADDLDISIIEDNKINLIELVREQILLNLPEQIFCLEDCQGLCPKCGANRNLIDCNCIEKEVDPRWRGLRELKIKNEK